MVSAADGGPDQGAFVFTVKTAAVTTPTPVATNTAGQTTIPTATNTGGTSLWVPVVVGIIAILVGLGLGVVLGRRQSASSLGTMRKAVMQQSQEDEPKQASIRYKA